MVIGYKYATQNTLRIVWADQSLTTLIGCIRLAYTCIPVTLTRGSHEWYLIERCRVFAWHSDYSSPSCGAPAMLCSWKYIITPGHPPETRSQARAVVAYTGADTSVT